MNTESPELNKSKVSSRLDTQSIIASIAEQIKQRKRLLLIRTSVASLSLIVAVVILFNAGEIMQSLNFSDSAKVVGYGVVSILLVMTFFWSVVTSKLFKVERHVWIDAHFDAKELSQKQSWQIAVRLFWPTTLLSFGVFLRYYMPLGAVWLALAIGYGTVISLSGITFNVLVFILALIAASLSIGVMAAVLHVKLRYLLFVFLDTYGQPGFSYAGVFRQMRDLNRTAGGKEVMRIVGLSLGYQATEFAATAAMNFTLTILTRNANVGGRVVAETSGLAESEAAATMRSYAEEITYYLYYRAARQVIQGVEQEVNEAVYTLADDSAR